MKSMKWPYCVALSAVILGTIAVCVVILRGTSLDCASMWSNAIQAAGVGAALSAAIIALSQADPKKPQVKVQAAVCGQLDAESVVSKQSLPQELRDLFADYPDPIVHFRVPFCVKNVSGIALAKPTLTLMIPERKARHPRQLDAKTWGVGYATSLTGDRSEVYPVMFAEKCVFSNAGLPYWNDQGEVRFWIRMVLDDGNRKPFKVEVSLNSENAEGRPVEVDVQPEHLLGHKAAATNK